MLDTFALFVCRVSFSLQCFDQMSNPTMIFDSFLFLQSNLYNLQVSIVNTDEGKEVFNMLFLFLKLQYHL